MLKMGIRPLCHIKSAFNVRIYEVVYGNVDWVKQDDQPVLMGRKNVYSEKTAIRNHIKHKDRERTRCKESHDLPQAFRLLISIIWPTNISLTEYKRRLNFISRNKNTNP